MQASNRTFICCVVFLDIVGYSKKPVSEQIQLKERLNTVLTEALANVAVNDRIILDTGDGAALSFLGDPEDALFVSLTLRDAMTATLPQGTDLPMRIGINLGPVKLVKDINGHPNIIGDGINVAQRVMSFAAPGQVLVSRSYYEVVSCLSDEYVRLFHYEGSRTDKHVREHEVYAVQASGEVLQRVTASTPRKKKDEAHGGQVMLDKLSQSTSFVAHNLRRKPRVGTALTVIAILAIAVVLRLNRKSEPEPVAQPQPPKRVAAAPAREAAKPPIPEPRVEAAPAKAIPAKPPISAPKVEATPAKAISAKPADPVPPAGPATANFTILPWGEVYIDGKRHGVSPPLRDVELTPGRHRIEVRNAEFEPYTEVVDAKPGSRIRIRHRFR
jgi:class 3 adenylate cyclase